MSEWLNNVSSKLMQLSDHVPMHFVPHVSKSHMCCITAEVRHYSTFSTLPTPYIIYTQLINLLAVKVRTLTTRFVRTFMWSKPGLFNVFIILKTIIFKYMYMYTQMDVGAHY